MYYLLLCCLFYDVTLFVAKLFIFLCEITCCFYIDVLFITCCNFGKDNSMVSRSKDGKKNTS